MSFSSLNASKNIAFLLINQKLCFKKIVHGFTIFYLLLEGDGNNYCKCILFSMPMQGIIVETKHLNASNVVRIRLNLFLLINFCFDIQYHSIGHS